MKKRVLQEDLLYEILSVVADIPEGAVATYGQIARLIGRDRNARLVGKVLSMSEYYGEYPCHRVVNVVFHIPVCFSDSDNQVAFHLAELGILLFPHFPYGIVALDGDPGQICKLLPQLVSQRKGKTIRFIVYCVKLHNSPAISL